jgi:hypothetical protein
MVVVAMHGEDYNNGRFHLLHLLEERLMALILARHGASTCINRVPTRGPQVAGSASCAISVYVLDFRRQLQQTTKLLSIR